MQAKAPQTQKPLGCFWPAKPRVFQAQLVRKRLRRYFSTCRTNRKDLLGSHPPEPTKPQSLCLYWERGSSDAAHSVAFANISSNKFPHSLLGFPFLPRDHVISFASDELHGEQLISPQCFEDAKQDSVEMPGVPVAPVACWKAGGVTVLILITTPLQNQQ